MTASLWCLHSQIPLYSPLALFLKPTWHSALHAEEQEIKLRSALVCWADLLPPHCYLIIQELWNVLLYGSMQPECLCLPLMTAASQSFSLCMRGFKCVCVCVYSARVSVCACACKLMAIHAGVIYTDNIPSKTSRLDLIHRVLNYGHREIYPNITD